ncbi:tetratricopeptide repeat protein [Allosphingosinicella flava]|uniref:Tetratricopeptide repeat protein n=1 Tax=Allosphingosinicella flava TaxID=2771430 RepID=A0A7T2LLX3_9SPHN|nr:tetratricopeptide repeat protein [Sphingosinicella flava]QPQ54941.1 tetratricopeptide repeat protein [Sphingosinicella flava]
MRISLIVAMLMAGAAMPAAAQSDLGRRVEKLERDVQAVQRKVFPGGAVQPEIVPQQDVATSGVPATSAVADLTARVDALESQLRTLTGQTEENAYRVRQLEEAFNRYRADMETRLAKPVPQPAEEAPSTAPPTPEPAQAETPAAAADPGEQAYLTGYRLWDEGKYGEAQAALEAMVKKYPKHARASYGQNLLGRAYLDDGKPATAAKIFLSNYQTNPKGERAADSLYFLGQALTALKKPAEACKVYDELADVYPTMRDWVKQRLPKARQDAKCS